LKYLTDTQKFLSGLIRQPPRKLNNPTSRLETVIADYLGLADNPVWIISDSNVFLSMPDDLSLTKTSIFSKIPKGDLMKVCKIDMRQYWDEKRLGKVAEFGNKKIAKLHKDIDKYEEEIRGWKEEKSSASKEKKKDFDKKINRNQKKIEQLEDKISKIKSEEKTYTPNSFIFGNDDANKAENTELLSDGEKQDLLRNKQEMQEKLLDLNPYDDNEFETMLKDLEKNQRSHPFDFDEEKTPAQEKPEESEMEKLLRLREEYYNKENKR
jgi:hypothetical protein